MFFNIEFILLFLINPIRFLHQMIYINYLNLSKSNSFLDNSHFMMLIMFCPCKKLILDSKLFVLKQNHKS